MTVTATNILMGAGFMYIGDVGADLGTVFATGDVGGTEGGVTMAYEPEYKEIEVDQAFAPVAIIKIKEKMTVKTQMAESTLKNMMFAYGLPDKQLVNGKLSFGQSEISSINPRQLLIVGKAPNGEYRLARFHKAVARGNAEYAFKKGDVTYLNVEMTILAETSLNDGEQLGYVEDMVADPRQGYDAAAPALDVSSPVDGAADVAKAADTEISATLTKNLYAPSIDLASVQLISAATGLNVATAVALDAVNKKKINVTHGALEASTKHFLRINKAVKSVYNIPLAADIVVDFTTGL